MQEIWKTYIKNYRSLWEVSSEGRVKRNGIIYNNLYISKNGYCKFAGGFLLHRAVAELFIPNPENKPCIDHINGNKHDNRVCNLRWVTHSENMLNPITRKRNSEIKLIQNKGKNNPMYGKIHDQEWRKNHSEKMNGKYTNTKIMNDGYIQLKVKKEHWGEFIDIGFRFGKIK